MPFLQNSFKDLLPSKEMALENEDAITVSLMIINSLLKYTNELDTIPDSVFDINEKGSTSSDGENKVSAIEYYDFEEFFEHCVELMGCDENTIILAMMALDKLIAQNTDFKLSNKNVSKVIFLCLMETQKMHDDESFKNSDYCEVAGISPEELLESEYNFLRMIDFNMYISESEFNTYKENFTSFY